MGTEEEVKAAQSRTAFETASDADTTDIAGPFGTTSPLFKPQAAGEPYQQGDLSLFDTTNEGQIIVGIGDPLADSCCTRSERYASWPDTKSSHVFGPACLDSMALSSDRMAAPSSTIGLTPDQGSISTSKVVFHGKATSSIFTQANQNSANQSTCSADAADPLELELTAPDGDYPCPEPGCKKRMKRLCDLRYARDKSNV